jgi:hypothetical protein
MGKSLFLKRGKIIPIDLAKGFRGVPSHKDLLTASFKMVEPTFCFGYGVELVSVSVTLERVARHGDVEPRLFWRLIFSDQFNSIMHNFVLVGWKKSVTTQAVIIETP